MSLIKVEGKITIYQRRQTWQLILKMFIVIGVFQRLLFDELIFYTVIMVVVVVLFLVSNQDGVLSAFHLMCLPHLRQVLVLLSEVFKLSFNVNVLSFQCFRFTHQVVDAFTFLEATFRRCNFVSFSPTFSSILVFGR